MLCVTRTYLAFLCPRQKRPVAIRMARKKLRPCQISGLRALVRFPIAVQHACAQDVAQALPEYHHSHCERRLNAALALEGRALEESCLLLKDTPRSGPKQISERSAPEGRGKPNSTVPTSIRSRTRFAKLKALLRAAAERTADGLWDTIGSLIDRFTPEECAHYFAAAGYDAN
jgi:hypothetical protein